MRAAININSLSHARGNKNSLECFRLYFSSAGQQQTASLRFATSQRQLVTPVGSSRCRPWLHWHCNQPKRNNAYQFFSTTLEGKSHASVLGIDDDGGGGGGKPASEVVLYHRLPGGRTILRMGFGISYFHTAYWLWYATDFVPTINASPVTDIHIDPAVPTVGIFFALIVQSIFTVYPKRLISQVSWRPKTNEILLYTYTFPLINPQLTKPSVVAPMGTYGADLLSTEVTMLVEKLGGDLTRFQGYLSLSKPGTWPPYLIDVRANMAEQEFLEPEIMLEVLLDHGEISEMYSSKGDDDEGDGDDASSSSWRAKVAKRAQKTSHRGSSRGKSQQTSRKQEPGGEGKLRKIARRRRS